MTNEGFYDLYILSYSYFSIADAIENSWVIICFPTPAYQDSNACRKELCFAEKKGKRIVPILTTPDWEPSSWLALTIASVPCFKWENIQPHDVEMKMPDLLQRLSNLATGNLSRTRVPMSRNFASEQRFQTDRPIRNLHSPEPTRSRSRPN